MKFEQFIYRRLGSHACGNVVAPCDWMSMHGGISSTYPVVHITEDAFTLWIGSANEWAFHMSRREARRLAWFVLWRWWICGEWFGLRRALWYWALRRVVKTPPLPDHLGTRSPEDLFIEHAHDGAEERDVGEAE